MDKFLVLLFHMMGLSLLNLFTTWLVLFRKRFLEKKQKKMRGQLKFCRTMRNDIMQKAPGMRFVYIYSIL